MRACLHPKMTGRTRETIDLGGGVFRIEETCRTCGASRHYVRDDRRRTMGDWAPWSGHKLAEPESR
jgi:DnaJ-class molecular chaperone